MRTRAPRVVGRKRELEVLASALASARDKRGGALFLIGEPGIGKSRLAEEAVDLAYGAGMYVLRGRGSSVGRTVPFRPLAEAVLSVFRTGDPPSAAELGAYRPVLGKLVPEWSDGNQAAGNESLVVLGEALLRLTALLGRRSGCLLVLDDLHDADAETLTVLDYVIDNLADQPTLLLVTSRDEPCDLLELGESAAQRQLSTMHHLDRLDQAEVSAMAGACLDVHAADVPAQAADLLWANSAGNPFMVEELLHEMVSNGTLTWTSGGCWTMVDERRPDVPVSLVRSIGQRVDRLGPQARRMLSVAAVLGRRFPLAVVQRVTGMEYLDLLSHLRAGVAVQLIGPDEPSPDWYAFQHPLTAEALLAALTPSERAEISGRAADAIESIYPALPGEWCQLAASLRMDGADQPGAAQLFAEAGRRALADGAVTSAISLLEQAEQLLRHDTSAVSWAEVMHTLLYALTEAGQFDRAIHLVDRLYTLPGHSLSSVEQAALHIRLARTFDVVGRWEDAAAQLNTARILLGPEPSDENSAELDALAAELAMESPNSERHREAEQLARRALAITERVSLPAIACQAWLTIGTVARGRDLVEAGECFHRARVMADEHRLPNWRIHALFLMAGNDWLAYGDATGYELVGREATRIGSVTIGCLVDSTLALHATLIGRYQEAEPLIAETLALSTRLRMDTVRRYLLMVSATSAAHRGDRRTMEHALAEFREARGEHSREFPLSIGLARVFCALLEENWQLAWHDLGRMLAVEDTKPTPFSLSGRHGLHLLLGVLRGEAGNADAKEVGAHVAGTMRWNRQFVMLANAVLLGRQGDVEGATTAFRAAQDDAAIYPLAKHLGLRLVAGPAIADGWGEPLSWLRTAEEYFHQNSIPAVASACRAQLRQAGVPVPQRRKDSSRIPPALRMIGVTAREFEVFELLPRRLSNKAIGDRLHISDRTVEKHIASLMVKTSMPDRASLSEYAAADLE